MKIKNKLKLIKFKYKLYNKFIKVIRIILYPIAYIDDKICKKKINNKRNPNNYNYDKVKKLLYSKIQDKLIKENELFVMDIDYISESEDCWGIYKLSDLFSKEFGRKLDKKYIYLDNYYYYTDLKDKDRFWYDIISKFNTDEICVTEINKEQFRNLNKDWEYIKYSDCYRKSKRILYISKRVD